MSSERHAYREEIPRQATTYVPPYGFPWRRLNDDGTLNVDLIRGRGEPAVRRAGATPQ